MGGGRGRRVRGRRWGKRKEGEGSGWGEREEGEGEEVGGEEGGGGECVGERESSFSEKNLVTITLTTFIFKTTVQEASCEPL